MMYVLLIVGFILLIKGADFFVDGASSTDPVQLRVLSTDQRGCMLSLDWS